MKRFVKSIFVISTILIVMGFLFSFAYAEYLSSPSFQIENPIIGVTEGGISTSTSFQYISSSGQLDSGQSTSTSFGQNAGFLYFPIATTPVVSTTSGNQSVLASWTASVGTLGNITSYEVGISTNSGGPFTYTNVGSATNNNFTSLTNGTTYYFKVRTYISGLIVSDSAVVSSTPSSPTPSTSGGGGGGGSIGGLTGTTTTTTGGRVNISGRAYPTSKVVILKDGVTVATTTADPLANFSVSVSSLISGNYTFSIYGEDSDSRKSTAFSFPVYVTSDSTINIGGVFLSPTIDVDKSTVKQGENVAIFGQSVPDSEITISVHSAQEFFNKVKTDKNGVYLLNFDTTPLELGGHTAKSKSAVNTEVSPFGNTVAFAVGNESKKKETVSCSNLRGDLNCDNRVNLVDFSIMAFWYKKNNPPQNIDLNSDGIISLVDFSIMAFNWTG